jgi:hypothetical protein
MSQYFPEEGFDYPEEGSVDEKEGSVDEKECFDYPEEGSVDEKDCFDYPEEGSVDEKDCDIENILYGLELILEKNNGKQLSQQTLAALEIPNGFKLIEVGEFNGRDYVYSYSVISETERYNEFGDLLEH